MPTRLESFEIYLPFFITLLATTIISTFQYQPQTLSSTRFNNFIR